jgi:hypothetical protein
MLPPPMLRDVSPGAKPDSIVPLRVLQELDQSDSLGWPPNETIMQIDRHHLGMFGAFFVEQVETIHHVARETVSRAEPRVAVKAVIVRLEGRRDHEMAPLAKLNPEGKLIAQVIAIVQKAAMLDQQASRIAAWTAIEPSYGRLPDQLLDSGNREPDMLTLGLLIDFKIIEPPVAVTDNLVTLGDKGLRQLRALFKRPDDAEDTDLDVEPLEDAQQAPASAARGSVANLAGGGIPGIWTPVG